MIYRSKQRKVKAWASAAQAKLEAENVDTTDIDAVHECLRHCVGDVFTPWMQERGLRTVEGREWWATRR